MNICPKNRCRGQQFTAKITQLHAKLNQKLTLDVSPILLAVMVFAVSLGMRLYFLNKGFFHHDSISYMNALRSSVADMRLCPLIEGRYAYVAFGIPFYLLFQALQLPMDLAFNALTAALASFSVLMLYLLLMEVVHEKFAAASAALIFSFMPVYFSVSTHTMIHPFSLLLSLSAFYLLIRGNRSTSCLPYLGASFLMALAVSARFPNVILLVPFLIVYLQPVRQNWKIRFPAGKFSVRILCIILPLLIAAAWMFWIQKDALIAKSQYDRFLGFFSPLLLSGFRSVLENVGWTGWLLLVIGICSMTYYQNLAYLCAFLVWVILLFFFYSNVSTYADRFLTVIFPMLAVFMALGLQRMHRYSRIMSLFFLFYLIGNMFLTVYPLVSFRKDFSGEKEFALWLKEKTNPDDIIIAMDDGVFLEYYAERQYKQHPQNSLAEAVRWADELEEMLHSGTVVYIISSGFMYDPGRIIRDILDERFKLLQAGSHLTEDYHKASLKSKVYEQELLRLTPLFLNAN